MKRVSFALLLFSISYTPSVCQEGSKPMFQLLQANELEGAVRKGRNVRILKGDVAFFYYEKIVCDSACHYFEDSLVEAYGNVRVIEKEEVQLKTNYLKIDGKNAIGVYRKSLDSANTKKTVFGKYDFKSGLILE
jgi:hypothetical protein